MLANRPATAAARCSTCVGLTSSNRRATAPALVRSPSLLPTNTQRQPGTGWAATKLSTALPTMPDPPVTRTTHSSGVEGGAMEWEMGCVAVAGGRYFASKEKTFCHAFLCSTRQFPIPKTCFENVLALIKYDLVHYTGRWPAFALARPGAPGSLTVARKLRPQLSIQNSCCSRHGGAPDGQPGRR